MEGRSPPRNSPDPPRPASGWGFFGGPGVPSPRHGPHTSVGLRATRLIYGRKEINQ